LARWVVWALLTAISSGLLIEQSPAFVIWGIRHGGNL
jgi:hypothetical protein